MDNNRSIPAHAEGSVVTFSIKISGEAIPEEVQLMRLSVNKEINKVASAKITILDGDAATEDFPVSNNTIFVPGNEVEIFADNNFLAV